MGKHTPGPWELDADPTATNPVWIIPTNGVKNGDYWSVCKCDGPNAKTNARLIAAAPDLLAALRALITEWDRPREIPADPDWCDAIVGQARAAIAKAEGTS